MAIDNDITEARQTPVADIATTWKRLPIRMLMISTDRTVFQENSAVRKRMLDYAGMVQELHMIVFTKSWNEFRTEQVSENLWIYPTNSLSRWQYVRDAIHVGKEVAQVHVQRKVGDLSVDLGDERLIDMVTAQDPFETGYAAWRLAKMIGVPLELQVHTDVFSPEFFRSSFLNMVRVPLAKFLLKRAAGVRVVSQRIRDSITNKVRFPVGGGPRITKLPLYVNIDGIKQAEPVFDLHKRYPEFTHVILMASRLEKEKNILLALAALKDTLKANKHWGIVIIGKGSQKHELERKVERFGLSAHVKFEDWAEDVISYYKTADIFLSTSNYEGYGMTLVEAVAAGCPLATTRVGVVGELLDDQLSLVCAPRDLSCFKIQLRKIIEDETSFNHFKELAKVAREKLEGESYEAYLAKIHEMWQRTAGV